MRFLFLFLLLPAFSFAQHSLNLNYNRGNNVRVSEDFLVDYYFKHYDSLSKNTFEANVNFLYGKQETDINARDFSISIREKLFFGPVDGFLNLQNDQSLARGIDNRITGGVGLEKSLIQKSGFTLAVSDGAIFELTEYSDMGEFVKVRNSFRVQIKNKGRVKFKSNLMIQNNVQDWGDHIFTSRTTLGFPVSKMVDVTANYLYIQESFVSTSIDFMSLGLQFNF
jgi:hypothetical protein